jgi:hypothetical protein
MVSLMSLKLIAGEIICEKDEGGQSSECVDKHRFCGLKIPNYKLANSRYEVVVN